MKLVGIGFGKITFHSSLSSDELRQRGIIETGSDAASGRPAHFKVVHNINFSHGEEGIDEVDTFHVHKTVLHATPDANYSQIEKQAAELLPSILRDLAALVEAEVRQSDAD